MPYTSLAARSVNGKRSALVHITRARASHKAVLRLRVPNTHAHLRSCLEYAPVLVQGAEKSNKFFQTQMDIADDAALSGKEAAMKLATKTLARALRQEVEVSMGVL